MELVNASLFLIWDIVKRVLLVFIQTEGVMKDLGLANPNPMVSIGEFIYEPLLSRCSLRGGKRCERCKRRSCKDFPTGVKILVENVIKGGIKISGNQKCLCL